MHGIESLAVVGGRTEAGKEAMGITPLGIMIREMRLAGPFRVPELRKILLKMEDPYVDLDLPFPSWHGTMDAEAAARIGRDLGVDAVCVVWTVSRGVAGAGSFEIMAQIFSAADGRSLGCFETSPGFRQKAIEKGRELQVDQLTTVSSVSQTQVAAPYQVGNTRGVVVHGSRSGYNRDNSLGARCAEVAAALARTIRGPSQGPASGGVTP